MPWIFLIVEDMFTGQAPVLRMKRLVLMTLKKAYIILALLLCSALEFPQQADEFALTK